MSFREQRQQMRQNVYKKGIDLEQLKKRREHSGHSIRKAKRSEQLMKRRNLSTSIDQSANGDQLFDIPDINKLSEYAESIKTSNPDMQYSAVIALRKLLSIENNPPIDIVISHGVVPLLVQVLRQQNSQNPRIQFEAAWALTNIASGTTEQTFSLLHHGAVNVFVEVLLNESTSNLVREQVIWALGNIAGDSAACRDYVLQLRVLPFLLQLTDPRVKSTMRRNAVWTISNLCRGKPSPHFALVQHSIPILINLLDDSDLNIVIDASWALSYLSDGENYRIEEMIKYNIAEPIVGLLAHRDPAVQSPALRVVGNLVTGEDNHTQAVIDAGGIPRLKTLLSHPSKNFVEEVCWTLSNITAGTTAQIQTILDDPQLVDQLRYLLSHGDFDVKKEAAWALANITSTGTLEQIQTLVNKQCLKAFCDLLFVPDSRVVFIALDALDNIICRGDDILTDTGNNPFTLQLIACGGVKQIESLNTHPNSSIAERAEDLLKKIDEDDLDDVPSVVPQRTQDSYVFGHVSATNPSDINF